MIDSRAGLSKLFSSSLYQWLMVWFGLALDRTEAKGKDDEARLVLAIRDWIKPVLSLVVCGFLLKLF